MAAAAADEARLRLQQNLQADSMKTVLRIPFFYGEEKDDATKVLEFIERFETSTTSMGLVTPAQKAAHFGSYLRGAAYQIHKSLASVRVDPDDWAAVRAYFLKKFRGEASAHTVINSFESLIQKKNEGIMPFYSRVLYETNLFTDKFRMPNDHMPASYAGIPEADKLLVQAQVRMELLNMIGRTYFIGGIKSNLKTELQRIAPEDLDGTVDAANKLDQTETKIHEIHEKSKINELADLDDEQLAEENPDNETITKINERRGRLGRQPFRRPKYQRGQTGALKCRYCKKPNHSQQNCYSRIAKNAPMVDEHGKPYTHQFNGKSKVHSTKEKDGENDGFYQTADKKGEDFLNWNWVPAKLRPDLYRKNLIICIYQKSLED